MLTISELIQIAFLAVFREQLDETRDAYPEKEWISLLISYAVNIFDKTEAKIIFKSAADEMAEVDEDPLSWHIPSADEFYTLTCDLKEKLRPIDYLLFKAWFTNDDEESSFLFKQAQMICPESFRMTVITYFMSESNSDNSFQILQELYEQARLSDQKAPRDYMYILNLIPGKEEDKCQINPVELANFLNKSSFSRLFKFSLLYLVMMQVDAVLIMQVLDRLTFGEDEDHLIWMVINAIVFSKLDEHPVALKWYGRINLKKLHLSNESKLELLYHYSLSLAYAGREEKSASILKELVFSGDYDDCYNDAFYHAVFALTRHNVTNGRADEASDTLAVLHDDDSEYLEEIRGEEYFLLMADKSMLEGKVHEALNYYVKAFELSGNEEIDMKIKNLKNGIV